MRVLGIDPGLHLTGYALVEFRGLRRRLVEAGVVRLNVKADLAERLGELHEQIRELIGEFKADHVGVEQLYAHYKHPRTAILMGHARGVILLAARQSNLPVTDLPSTLVKKMLTGHGHAGKGQIQRAVAAVCGLAKPPSPPDVADAIAIAWVLAGNLAQPATARRTKK